MTCFPFRTVAVLILALFIQACQTEPVTPPLFPASINPTGCMVEQLTDAPDEEYQFQGVSRDGQWLAYVWSNGEDADGITVRGSILLNLVTGEREALPAVINNGGTFSADGAWLIGAQFVSEENTEIYEYHLETGETTVLEPAEGWDFLPSYAPDGASIVFNSARSGNFELYRYDLESQTLYQLTTYAGYDAHGEFSADGRQLLFHRMVAQRDDGGYDLDLYRYNLESGEETRLTNTGYEESYASWAPDGETFVFSSDIEEEPENHNLYVMEPNGTITQLTDGAWKDSYAYWMRDGSYVYFNSTRSGNSDIYRIRMNGLSCAEGT